MNKAFGLMPAYLESVLKQHVRKTEFEFIERGH